MDGMSRTREQLLRRLTERESARLRIAFWIAAIVGGVGWVFAWALAAWGWAR